MTAKHIWAQDTDTLAQRLSPEEFNWLQAVADRIKVVVIDGVEKPATPERLVLCLQDEPQDMYDDGMSAEEYAEMVIDEYGVVSNEEL